MKISDNKVEKGTQKTMILLSISEKMTISQYEMETAACMQEMQAMEQKVESLEKRCAKTLWTK